jgi:hypothetical protein
VSYRLADSVRVCTRVMQERRVSAQAEYMCTLERLQACLPELDAHLHVINDNAKAVMRRPRSASAVALGTLVKHTANEEHS